MPGTPSPPRAGLCECVGRRASELGPRAPSAGTAELHCESTRGTTVLGKGTGWNGLLVVLAVL